MNSKFLIFILVLMLLSCITDRSSAQANNDTVKIALTSLTKLKYDLDSLKTFADSIQKIKQDSLSYKGGDSLIIGINGFGNLQPNLLNNSRGPDGNIALGVSFNRKWNKPWSGLKIGSLYFKININVASSADTLSLFTTVPNSNSLVSTRALGQYLLYPITSTQTADLDLLYYLHKNYYGLISGLNLKVMASNRNFKFSKEEIINAVGIYYRVGVFHDFIPEAVRFEHGISIRAGLSITRRFLRGDIELDNYSDQFELILPDGENNFTGLELNFALNIKDIAIELNLPFKTNTELPGLGGAQFSDLVTFGGGLKLPLDARQKETTNPTDI